MKSSSLFSNFSCQRWSQGIAHLELDHRQKGSDICTLHLSRTFPVGLCHLCRLSNCGTAMQRMIVRWVQLPTWCVVTWRPRLFWSAECSHAQILLVQQPFTGSLAHFDTSLLGVNTYQPFPVHPLWRCRLSTVCACLVPRIVRFSSG